MDITAQVSQHDSHQIEIKLACPIEPDRKLNDCHIELFFFLPRNLDVNAHTYTGRDFYNDLFEHIRFKTPVVTLDELAAHGSAILQRLETVIEKLPEEQENYLRHLKMYCSIAKSALRDGEIAVENVPPDRRDAAVRAYLRQSRELLRAYRKLRSRAKERESGDFFALADEFLSLSSGKCLIRLWDFLAPFPEMQKLRRSIARLLQFESQYRTRHNYPSVSRIGQDNAELVYRESTLKKNMADILFLQVETRKDGVIVENLLLSLAAAAAMIFATSVSFLWKGLFLQEFSASFFVVWVIAYMFKDRIKASLQTFFSSHRSRYSYDYRQRIRDGFGNEIGVCRESFRYCDGSKIDPEVDRIRGRTILTRLENGSLAENVLIYRKKIELRGDGCKDIFREFNVNGIVDIFRIDIQRWTAKMDNPSKIVFYSDGETLVPLKAHRDYHVNLVIRCGESGKPDHYTRCRLILCRSGIRVLSFPGEHGAVLPPDNVRKIAHILKDRA